MIPEKGFDGVLDECVDRLNRGETIEACLADYPQHAGDLAPLLKAMTGTKTAYSFTPSANAKRAARERFNAALEKRREPSIWQNLFAHRFVLTAAATVVVIALAAFIALRTPVFQGPIPAITVAAPSALGNFAFLVSDEVNAISDFSDLKVTIEKVSLLQTGNSSQWVEFTPEVKEFDLTVLPGDVTQQLWRGNVPEGAYIKVVIYVTAVKGTLKTSGEILDIKLPSNKLQMSIPFEVGSGNVTSFTYDLTVVKTGSSRNSKYILKPQLSESGASQQPATPAPPASVHNRAPANTPAASHNQTPGGPPASTHNQTITPSPAVLPDPAKGKPQK